MNWKKYQSSVFAILFLLLSNLSLFAQKEYYTPESLIMPFHDKEKQLHISAGKGGGWDLNLSYSFSKHFSFFVAGTYDKGLKRRITIMGDPFRIKKDDYAIRAGLGYFKKIDLGRFNILEINAGAGTYSVKNYWYFPESNYGSFLYADYTNANFWSIFSQIQLGVKNNIRKPALGFRFSFSKYRNFIYYESGNKNVQTSLENVWSLNLDPVVSYSYFFKDFKLNVQGGASVPLVKSKIAATTTHTFYNPPSTYQVTKEKSMILFTFLGRLSIQYNLHLKTK